MAILRIATAQADMTTFGGTMTSDTTYYDSTRVDQAFFLNKSETAFLDFPAAVGTSTWLHAVCAQDGVGVFNDQVTTMVRDISGNDLASIRIDGNQLYFRVHGDVFFEGGVTTISVDSAYVVDIQVVINAGVDITVRGYINSALQFDSVQANTAARTNPTKLEFLNTDTGAHEHDNFFSEVIVADEDTRGFRLRELKPQSFGVFQQWDGTVTSVVDASLATGISTDVADERTSFGLAKLDQVDAGDIINRVVAQSYAQRGAAGLTAMNHFFRYDDTTIQDGANISLGLFGAWYVDEYVTNPKTAASWVPADLEGIQMGVRARA